MSSVSSRTPSRSSARTITPHSKFLTTKPTPSPCTFANMFVSAQCVKGHWYFPVQDKCLEQEHTEMQKMLENEFMKSICTALVAAASPPVPAQEFICAIAPAARDALDKYEQGEEGAFEGFITMFPTIATFPQLIPFDFAEAALPAEVAAVLNEPEREEYVIVDVPAEGEEPARRFVIHPVRARRPRARTARQTLCRCSGRPPAPPISDAAGRLALPARRARARPSGPCLRALIPRCSRTPVGERARSRPAEYTEDPPPFAATADATAGDDTPGPTAAAHLPPSAHRSAHLEITPRARPPAGGTASVAREGLPFALASLPPRLNRARDPPELPHPEPPPVRLAHRWPPPLRE